MEELTKEEIEKTHNKLRSILIEYGNPEYGDCIIDDICFLFGNYPNTFDKENIDAYDRVYTDLDEAVDALNEDSNCTEYFKNWILNRIDEIENRNNNFNLIQENQGLGWILDEFENLEDEPIRTSTFWYDDFI